MPTAVETWSAGRGVPHITECSVCPNGKYRIAAATCSDHEPAVSCYECPKTANCLTEGRGSSVLSLAGYWCGQLADAQSRLDCTACPDGYCSSDEARPWNESCLSSRRGTLCGECAADHSEAVGTDECVPDTECNAARWLVPAVFAIGSAYVVLVVWLPINHHPLWKSITYFMQTVPLVSSPDNALLRATTAVFALDPSILGVHVTACPWPGLSAVEKMTTDYVLPVVLLLELVVMLAAHRLVLWLRERLGAPSARRCANNHASTNYVGIDSDDDHHAHGSEYARYVGALTALVLLMYEGVTSATMDLLNCVPWDGALRLFRAGYVTCYAAWQYPLFAVLGGVLVPFPLLLLILRRWLSSRQRRRGSSAWGWAVLHVLEGPYTRERAWWESVGMLRRLALLAVATFVPDPMWRALGLAAGCFVVLLSHAYLRPYADRYYGWAETLFLCDLTLVAVLQIPQATYAALGQPFDGAAAEAVSYLQEALALLPLAFCAYMLARRYGPPLLDWLRRKRYTFFRGSEDAREDDTDASEQEGLNKPHRRHAADDEEEEERLLSDDGTEHGAEDADEPSMHHSNDDSPSLAKLIELQVGRFSQYLDAPSL